MIGILFLHFQVFDMLQIVWKFTLLMTENDHYKLRTSEQTDEKEIYFGMLRYIVEVRHASMRDTRRTFGTPAFA